MPIDIVQPVGTRIGPGMFFIATSDFIGPFPVDARVNVTITDPVTEHSLVSTTAVLTGHTVTCVIGQLDEDFSTLQPPAVGLVDGANVLVQTTITSAGGVVIDYDSSSAFTWDAVTGLYVMPRVNTTSSITPGHDPMLDLILAAVRRELVEQIP